MAEELDLDELDRQILEILQKNARIPFTEIARRLDKPDTTIHFRIKKMTDIGIIKSFTILVSPQSLGYSISALFVIDIGGHVVPEISIESAQKMSQQLLKRYVQEVRFLGSNKTTLFILAMFKNEDELEKIILNLKNNPDIQKMKIWKISSVLKGGEIIFST